MLATTYEVFQNAYKGHYMVPAVNIQGGTYDIIWAVCMAAKELRSPIILAHYVNTEAYSGYDRFYETVKWIAAKVSIPVAIHLGRGDNFGHCMEMLELGFTSIMFDGSIPLVEENVAATGAVARAHRSFDTLLEAEIGELCRLSDRGNKMGAPNTTDPDMVRQYLKLYHPNPLVIDIGNAHGFYNGPVDIRVEVLEKCKKLTDIPSVLRGCTDMGKKLVKRSIDNGVTKINFGTQVRCQCVNYLKEGLAEGKDQGHAWRLSQYAELRLCEDIKDIIKLAGSQEKA